MGTSSPTASQKCGRSPCWPAPHIASAANDWSQVPQQALGEDDTENCVAPQTGRAEVQPPAPTGRPWAGPAESQGRPSWSRAGAMLLAEAPAQPGAGHGALALHRSLVGRTEPVRWRCQQRRARKACSSISSKSAASQFRATTAGRALGHHQPDPARGRLASPAPALLHPRLPKVVVDPSAGRSRRSGDRPPGPARPAARQLLVHVLSA